MERYGGLRRPGAVLVVSCYESGHQPLAAASLLGFFERAGFRPAARDLAVEPEPPLRQATGARLILFSVPMHTALSVAVAEARRLRTSGIAAHVCFYGLYADLNASYLLDGLADSVAGGECEPTLVALAEVLERGGDPRGVAHLRLRDRTAPPALARPRYPAPSRDGLPALERYARLVVGKERRVSAAVETSRGCLHRCRHCPITPVYGGRFFAVPRDIVHEDIAAVVRAGARHVTFADPDFFNGPTHAMRVVRRMHADFPDLTFDCTIKIEHLLRRRGLLAELAAAGCLFVVSAVESLSDAVLRHLAKGHTRDDVSTALELLREVGIALRPSFVAFTPWTTLADYAEMLDWVAREELVLHVDPVQYSIRLLVPPGSPLAEQAAMRPHLRELVPRRLSWTWVHPDPRMDRLQLHVARIVAEAARSGGSAEATFDRVVDAATSAGAGPPPTRFLPRAGRAAPPRLTEPWFC